MEKREYEKKNLKKKQEGAGKMEGRNEEKMDKRRVRYLGFAKVKWS